MFGAFAPGQGYCAEAYIDLNATVSIDYTPAPDRRRVVLRDAPTGSRRQVVLEQGARSLKLS